MTLAKGLGGGVPIAVFLAKERASVFAPGEHGSTFGGNPLVCAAGVATLQFIIDNNIPDKVKKLGQYLIARLEKLQAKFNFITDIRGRGLLLAFNFADNISQDVVEECMQEGLLLNAVKPNALRFIPPLIITEKDIDEALRILEKVLARRL
jgi:acetylornithine/N-succinyldiaminopimelate aminotransferase